MRRSLRNLIAAVIGSILFVPAGVSLAQITLEPAFPALTFSQPVDVQHAPGMSDRLFVVEKAGIIREFLNERTTSSADVFLDLTDRVFSAGYEEGLLGLAFHPDYDENGRFFVYYNVGDPLRSRLSSFTAAGSEPRAADPLSEEILLEIEQPFHGHNGGQIRFGPDGFLYVSVGDGGGHGDNLGTGEDLQSLLGAMLRIDVNRADSGRTYAIPAENPFIGNTDGYREEIFAYGLRNPWRFSFDRNDFQDADSTIPPRIWTADVGAGSFEEINIVEKGKNYGWNVLEGFRCLGLKTDCDTTGRTPPVWEYDHYTGRAVIGGFVYRGSRLPLLSGRYIYGDYVSGRIWALSYEEGQVVENEELLHADSLRIYTFGEDFDGELIVAAADGDEDALYRLSLKPAAPAVEDEVASAVGVERAGNHPNPFRSETLISYELLRPAHITLLVHDILGRQIRTLVDAPQPSGHTQVVWDGTDDAGVGVPAGVYLFRLDMDGAAVDTGQMILLP